MTLDQAFDLALQHHRAGRLAEAEDIYRKVLGHDYGHAGALHLLGVLTCQTGRPRAAVDLIGRAIAVNPNVAEYHNDLGESYRRLGDLDHAVASFKRALELRPSAAITHNNLGNALLAQGRGDLAVAAYRKAIALNHNGAEFHANLGIALHGTGQRDAAITAYQSALALRPDDARVHSNLGVALQQSGRGDEALAAFSRAIALKDDDAGVHCNHGAALLEAGRLDDAISACTRAIELDRGYAEAHYNLGGARRLKGDLEQAIASLSRAIELKPDHALAHNNLGVVYHAAGEADLAIAAYRRAIELKPDHAEALNNLGNVLKDQGRLDDGLAALRRAVTVKPDFAKAASNILFTLNYHPDYDAEQILAEHRRWARQFADPLAAEVRPHMSHLDSTPDRRLRIGFLSPDLRGHPVGHSLLPLFLHRERRQCAFVGYSDVRAPDGLTEKLKALADEWHETASLGDAQVADQIRADRIDILVDTTLHTANNRILVFARKPAPVQVTMLGPPTTTGLDAMDYRLTDPYLDPPGTSDGDYTERSIRLPHCFWIFQPPEPAPPVTALPALANGFVTFGCLNQLAKVTRPALDLWVTILQVLPGSRLVLQSPRGSHQEAIRTLFVAGGIGAERLEFVTRAARRVYLERYQNLDLCLDPFPYNGHTSTFDALWMGVPVVTLAGRTAVGRGGSSILSNAGLPELIARSAEQYVGIAVALAGDLPRLAGLRAALRPRLQTSVLVDGRQYAADVQSAFRRMWQTLDGVSPDSIIQSWPGATATRSNGEPPGSSPNTLRVSVS